MKKIALLLALLLPILALGACGKEAAEAISPQDQAAFQAAEAAYETEADPAVEYLLYETGGRFVALQKGQALGVYDSREAALASLFEAPEAYLAVPVPETDWYICCKDFRGLTYVAFGDSITYGIDGNFRSGDAAYRMAYPYPTLVGDTLKLGAVRNEAISGASFCPHPKRANMTETILSFFGSADMISLMLGVNDFTSQLPLGEPGDRDDTTIYGCLHLISEYLTTMYPDAFVFYMTPFRYVSPDNGVYHLEDVAQAIKTVAAEYEIPVLDLYEHGRYELEMGTGDNDGIHPSQQHHRDYTAPLIAAFVAMNYTR